MNDQKKEIKRAPLKKQIIKLLDDEIDATILDKEMSQSAKYKTMLRLIYFKHKIEAL